MPSDRDAQWLIGLDRTDAAVQLTVDVQRDECPDRTPQFVGKLMWPRRARTAVVEPVDDRPIGDVEQEIGMEIAERALDRLRNLRRLR